MTDETGSHQNETFDNQPAGPLEGVVVLDLSRILAAPTATQLLGDLGAEVIKVERPGVGDDTRAWGPPWIEDVDGNRTRESAYYLSSNRNKRSVCIDMSSPAGQEAIRALALQADVLVENFKLGDLDRYGLGPDQLLKLNPKLIYCSVSGFGRTGPNAHRAGYDLLAQAAGGIMSITGEPDGLPMKVGVGIADVMCGMYAATSILAALRWRDQKGGEGQHIDIALLDSQIAWLVNEGVNTLVSEKRPERRGNQHPNIAPYQVFPAADGHLVVAVGNDGQFRRFAAIIGAPDLAADPRFATNPSRLENRDALLETITPLIAAMTRDALLGDMERDGVPGGPILTIDEVFESPQGEARGMKIRMPHPTARSGDVPLIGNPVKFSKTPITYRLAPPTLGQHTESVLRERLGDAGYEKARADGALGDEQQ